MVGLRSPGRSVVLLHLRPGPPASTSPERHQLVRFFEDESCGQCTPCRVGTEKAVKLMAEAEWDEKLLNELSQAMTDASICGLGQAAANPLKMVLAHFADDIICK